MARSPVQIVATRMHGSATAHRTATIPPGSLRAANASIGQTATTISNWPISMPTLKARRLC